MNINIYIGFISVLTSHGLCYPNGLSVDSSCSDLTPLHGVSSQNSTPPYSLTFSPTTFSPGQTVAVTLTGLSTGFLGFMIQARKSETDQSQEMFGAFSGNFLTRPACYGKALVQSSKTLKQTITFSWIAPDITVGNVIFRVTYIQKEKLFWTNKQSSTLIDISSRPVTPLTSPVMFLTTAVGNATSATSPEDLSTTVVVSTSMTMPSSESISTHADSTFESTSLSNNSSYRDEDSHQTGSAYMTVLSFYQCMITLGLELLLLNNLV
ncbi:DOMON domain-containing protein frrs1L [Biomphalaria glabrata]